jgi:hypothetical protein
MADDLDTTRLAGSRSGPASPGAHRVSGPESIDHGRFAPGTIIGGRYRMIGRLGSGGMGEVYRADDLKLGQSVALKFLPEAVDRDPARLTQLHSEVRIARQISHPHVCRVYDIDDYEGHTFLSMEYVDGEDLASLLRRVGRLSPNRAIELSRQICTGLAAAHDRGVVHRDLKPANIMLDGAGHIRITDFGLAGAIGDAARAGTPAYMAPEQLAGQPVTPRSDLYSLGLVLYELFTGERALTGQNLAELIGKREELDITPPSAIVRDLDPTIERAILRCLERDPARRPAAALAVAAALPGGDPLAALAAGGMLSPEVVAAAGEEDAWALRPALASLAFVLIGLVVLVLMADRVLITGYVPLDAPVAIMADRAEQIREKLGYTEPVADRAAGLSIDGEGQRFVSERTPASERANALARIRPAPLRLWYRTSPQPLMPSAPLPYADAANPPLLLSGMTRTVVDGKGRLVSFEAVPPSFEPEASSASTGEPDWNALFALAMLPRDRFAPVVPRWTPPVYADTRAAWEGSLPESPDITLHLEAAAYRGRVTFFSIIPPWTAAARMGPRAGATPQPWTTSIVAFLLLAIIGGAALVARHNWRNGRGDRQGALRMAAVLCIVDFARRALLGAHLAFVQFDLGFVLIQMALSLMLAAGTWIVYMALEPFVRRYWPDSLISWTRLLADKLRDPRIGKDLLLGSVAGVAMGLVTWGQVLAPTLIGRPPLAPSWPEMRYLEGLVQATATVNRFIVVGVFSAMTLIFVVVLLRVIVRRVWLAGILATLLFVATNLLDYQKTHAVEIAAVVVIRTIMTFAAIRLGLLATVVAFIFIIILQGAPLTADAGKWYFATSASIVLMLAAIAICAFSWARAGQPLFGRAFD